MAIFLDIKGRRRTKSLTSYLVKWDAKCRSNIQKKVKLFFKDFWESDFVCEEMPVIGTKMKIDLYNHTKKIAIEVQGRQHDAFVPHFHITRHGYGKQLERDEKKAEWCKLNGIVLVYIREADLDNLSSKWFKDNYNILI